MGAGGTRPAGGKQCDARHGPHGHADSGSVDPAPNPGAARRGGYGARARHRAAPTGAAKSSAPRQPRSPSSLLIALGDLPRIVLNCIGWSVAGANSH